jgi:LAO/AO transport system kinase
MKAGIMEIADVFVANKADREGIEQLVQSIEAALSLQAAPAGTWAPPVLRTEATTGRGIDDLWAALQRFRARPGPAGAARRRMRYRERVRQLVGDVLLARLERALPHDLFEQAVEDVAGRRVDPYTAAHALVARAAAAAAPGAV